MFKFFFLPTKKLRLKHSAFKWKKWIYCSLNIKLLYNLRINVLLIESSIKKNMKFNHICIWVSQGVLNAFIFFFFFWFFILVTQLVLWCWWNNSFFFFYFPNLFAQSIAGNWYEIDCETWKLLFFSFFLKKKGIWLANIMEVKKSQFLHLLGSKIALIRIVTP